MTNAHSERGAGYLGPALMACVVLLYVPFAGNHALWDPWETHYGEVARQMATRGDIISLHYPCSPLERPEFFTKPALTFWLMASFLRLFGLAGASGSMLTNSWRAEWALRLPSLLLGLLAIWSVFVLVRRIANARAAVLSALVLATCPSFILLSRQAMTDLPFVAPMTIALVFVGLAILPPRDDLEVPRRRWGPLTLPHAPVFYALTATLACFALLPLALIAAQLRARLLVHGNVLWLPGFVVMLPYAIGLAFAFVWVARLRTKRRLYLASAWVWCGLATLAKGPAGLALPALIVALYLVVSGRWKEVLLALELPLGALLFIVVSFPWYHAMLMRHGAAFWNEFIGDNYIHRALGRHGDRGTFEYYVQWLAYGTFPWSGLAAVSLLRGPRGQLRRYALCWIIVDYVVVTLVVTKFHHYFLPLLPAVAIMIGLYLDELLDEPRQHLLPLLLIALPVTILSAVDLVSLPQRSLWLFNYDYVNVPGLGRAWPSPAIYGQRYEYARLFGWIAGAVVLAFAFGAWLVRRRRETRATHIPPWLVPAILVATAIAVACGPTTHGPAPTIESWRWLVPLALALPASMLFLRAAGVAWAPRLFVGAALVWCALLADKLVVEVSPHWSQKHVIAAYYAQRKGPQEPLLVWQLFWHGENFYTANQIYESTDDRERTVFLGDRPDQKLRSYIAAHPGRRLFFLVERNKLEALKALLPPATRASFSIVEDSNNKLVLARATN
jgi:4-amino-4-deoxy-L-arabinose transferase-like glycosyltransferase